MNNNKPENVKICSAQKSVIFFKTQDDFRKWLESHHEKETELIAGFYKTDSGKPSMNWPQSVDQALCFGWIDGIRRSIDKESYCIRFTPRRSTSNWSAVNIKKVEELTRAGLMKPAGLKVFSLRKENKSYENDALFLDSNYEIQFKENKKAWHFFSNQAPSYKKAIMRWIMNAVQEKTRQLRLEKTIKACEQQKRVT
ncbi:MAG: bacteriocin-protection protein [Ignavibacteria bacterium]|nr:bacteriocin-protection protein [Ignavibacteria bacterium]